MNDAEKQAECLRICGPDVDPRFHHIAPEMCPIAWDQWRNPNLRPAYPLMPPPSKKAKSPVS